MIQFLKRYRHYGHFLSALIILIFGLLAIHTSVLLSTGHEDIKRDYEKILTHPSLTDNPVTYEALSSHSRLFIKVERYQSWMYWSVIAIGLTGFILIILNADKLSKLEKANREKKLTLQLLEYRLAAMEASLEGIGIIDSEGNLNYMNKALMDIHGIDPDNKYEFIGNSWLGLYTEKGRHQVRNIIIPQLMEEGFWRGVSPVLRQDGKIIKAEMTLTLLPDGGFIGTARDITDKEKAEATHKETQNQLYQAQKMEAIGRLAGGIAHDFNNILAAMNGYAEFLIEDLEPDSPQSGFAQNILQAGRQARGLVDKILAFSRRKESSMDVADIHIPLQETLSMLKVSLPKTIELKTDIANDPMFVTGNQNQIAQLLMNLCVNAGDSIENEKGSLKLEVKKIFSSDDVPLDWLADSLPETDSMPLMKIDDISAGHTRLILGMLKRDTNYICVSVEDTGCGMSRVIMEHIFEPFFTTKPVDKGTGLGLSTVHGVVASHRAAMMINSRVGKGTRFDVYFPEAEQQHEPIEILPQTVSETTTQARILLVEDQSEVREMTMIMLKRLGYTVETATTGLEGLDAIRENPERYDLILTDQNMPKMTGIELVEQVSYDLPDLPFVMISGYSQEKLEDFKGEYPSIRAIIRKPVAQKQLGDILQNVLASGTGENITIN